MLCWTELVRENMWKETASEESINKTVAVLTANGVTVVVVENAEKAKEKAKDLISKDGEVMIMVSTTLETIGINDDWLKENGFGSVKDKLKSMDREKDNRQMQQIGAAPEYAIGSVHAVTEKGEILVASNTGSQLPAYASGADKVIWVVGTQKIVANFDEAMKRIYEYCLPLEDARARKAYGSGSGVNKILIVNKEKREGRLHMILVKEMLGF